MIAWSPNGEVLSSTLHFLPLTVCILFSPVWIRIPIGKRTTNFLNADPIWIRIRLRILFLLCSSAWPSWTSCRTSSCRCPRCRLFPWLAGNLNTGQSLRLVCPVSGIRVLERVKCLLVYMSLGTRFHCSVTLMVNKFRLISSLPCCTLMFKGSAVPEWLWPLHRPL